jgi:hypothetical protein
MKIIANIRNIQIKHLQHMCETYTTYRSTHLQHTSENTDKTLGTDTCNIRVKPLQHPQSTFATFIRNTCNIPLKHLKYTLATCAFSTTSPYCLGVWGLIGVPEVAARWRRASCGGSATWRRGSCAPRRPTPASRWRRARRSRSGGEGRSKSLRWRRQAGGAVEKEAQRRGRRAGARGEEGGTVKMVGRSAVECGRRLTVSFFFFKKTTVAGGEWRLEVSG